MEYKCSRHLSNYFFKTLDVSQSSEILIESKFWLGMYVQCILKHAKKLFHIETDFKVRSKP